MNDTVRLRYLAEVNPLTPAFDRVSDDEPVTFMPLETLWADGRLDTSRVRLKREVASGYVRFAAGDVLSPKVTPTFQAGRSAFIATIPCAAGAASTEVHVLRAIPGVADPRFVRYSLLTKPFLEEGVSRFQGVAGLQRVPDEYLRELRVRALPFTQQARLADFLDDQVAHINNLIASRRSQSGLLDESFAARVEAEVIGRKYADRHPSGLAWATDLPAEWPSVKLSLVARIGTGHTPSRSHPEYWQDCGIPWLTTSDVFKFRFQQIDVLDDTEVKINLLGLANSSAVMHPAGTVALSRTSGSAGFAIMMGRSMATSQDFATWTPGPRLRSEYLLWCLRVMRADLMGRLAMGSTHLTIYFPDLLSIRVPLPPVSAQDRAVGAIQDDVERHRGQQQLVQSSVQLLEELKRSLITAAVTGEFDVSSADGSQVSLP